MGGVLVARLMGTVGVAADEGIAPMERWKERDGGSADDNEELREGLPPLCKQCHALVENRLPEGLPNDTTSFQKQQSFDQHVHEKERYRLLNEETEERNRTLMQMIKTKDLELCHLKRNLPQLERHCMEESEKVKVYQEKCRDLYLKIERVEHLHSQQSMADSGSYHDSAATPPLLQVAANSVKDAVTVCASELFCILKKNSLPVNLAYLNLDPQETGQIIKAALQSFLCRILFTDFENPLFSTSNGLPPFEKPAKRKTHFLQVFKRCRDLDARQMFDEDIDFAHFFGIKESDLCMQLKEQLLMTDDVQKKEDFITSELHSRNNNYYRKFLRFVKAVWVLHKLAFAFEPSAEIFRVGEGSVLDEEFMEDVARDDDDDDEKMADSSRIKKQVRFMCVPGFTVRHTIIKSQVFSVKEETQHHTCCLKQDSSPMPIDSFEPES